MATKAPKSMFRDPIHGWKHFLALAYAAVADSVGLVLLLQSTRRGGLVLFTMPVALSLGAHGRIIASYLVHEAAHNTVFVKKNSNEWFGLVCLWLAGCPYADFDHIRKLHVAHHRDRSDPIDFDFQSFVSSFGQAFENLVLALEWAFIPAIETIMHFRTAFFPLFCGKQCTWSRRLSAWIGTPVMALYFYVAWEQGILFHLLLQGAFVLQALAMIDSFQHTYEAILISDPGYKPGPNGRTAGYEEMNTYTNVLSVQFPLLNLLVLNFCYHNAHHKKPMVAWYALPEWHNKLYSGVEGEAPSVLPVADLWYPWISHRQKRVFAENYGTVLPQGAPGRVDDFVGTLGASFLTV